MPHIFLWHSPRRLKAETKPYENQPSTMLPNQIVETFLRRYPVDGGFDFHRYLRGHGAWRLISACVDFSLTHSKVLLIWYIYI